MNIEDNKNEVNQENKKESKELTVKNKKSAKGKNGERILISGVITIAIIVILINIYFLVNIILSKVILPEFDFTENKVYTLSEETKAKIKNIENEIKITFINYDDTSSTYKTAEKYVLLNNNIKMEIIKDITSRKDLMDKYSIDATTQLIIINSGENETLLSDYDLYTYDYSSYETIDTTEEAFTNAIVDITTKDKPQVYFMTNHVAYNIENNFNYIMYLMEKDANIVNTLDILSAGKVPEDCDTLVITTLKEDITSFEKDKILEYINRGGEILLLVGPNLTGEKLTNFQEVLEQYAITIEEGVIFEGDSSNMVAGYPEFIIEEMQSNSITQKLNMNLSLCLIDAASIRFNSDKQEELKVEFEELAYTTEKAFLRKNLLQMDSNRTDLDSEETQFTIAGIVTKTIGENNTSKLIIFGNELFVSDIEVPIQENEIFLLQQYNNDDAVLNSIAYLNEREDIITIRKSYDTVNYTPTQFQHNIIMAIIFILPIIIIIVGIIIWQIRRRKK